MLDLINYCFTKRKMFISIFILINYFTFINCKELSCSNAKYFTSPGKISVDLLKSPVNGENLRICTSRMTCCTSEHEVSVHNVIKQSYDKHLRQTLYSLGSVLKSRAQRFDGFFKELLAKSKKEFHDMFKRTYGIIYEQNSFLFTDLFEELEKYFSQGDVDLFELLDRFFNNLYQRMFTVLNAQYTFDEKYLLCVKEHMKELKPFGDVPAKLNIQLKRSFVATRTFAQSLNVAGDIVHNMIKMPTSLDCARSMTKMAGCPMCQGYQNLKPCYNYCANVMKGCIAFQSELDHEWNVFVDATEKVAERLLGPFNIEMVVDPIDIKISEAIMNFQENSQHVSQRVFSGCGKPVLGRKRRQVSNNSGKPNSRPAFPLTEDRDEEEDDEEDEDDEDDEDEEEDETIGLHNNRQGNNRRINEDEDDDEDEEDEKDNGKEKDEIRPGGTGVAVNNENSASSNNDMDKLIKEIRNRVKQTRNFWSKLPYQMCNENEYFSAGVQDDNCWNGADRSRYTTAIVGDGLHNQQKNPEVKVDTSRQNSILNEQVYALKTISSKLRNAYNGMDVEWIDAPEEPTLLEAGSGSGWGGPDDDEDTIFRDLPSSSPPPSMYHPSTDEDISHEIFDHDHGDTHHDKSSSTSHPDSYQPSHPSSTSSSTSSYPYEYQTSSTFNHNNNIDIMESTTTTPRQPSTTTTQSSDVILGGDNIIPVVSVTTPHNNMIDDSNNNEDNALSPVSGFKIDNSKNKYNISSGTSNTNKAIVMYLLPIVVMWFGSSITDWLAT